MLNYLLWMNREKPFFACCFQESGFFPERAHHSVRLRLGSLGYAAASQSILKGYRRRMCTVSSRTPHERSAGVMGNRCGCFSPLGLICLGPSAVGWLWCLGWAHSQLYAPTRPLPPRWEIINTHQLNTRSADCREPTLCSPVTYSMPK